MVVVVVRAVAKQTMIQRHVAEALPMPSLVTSYRFCFLLCRRDPSFATKEPDAPKNLNNTPTTDGSVGLQTDRQRREGERERTQKENTHHHAGLRAGQGAKKQAQPALGFRKKLKADAVILTSVKQFSETAKHVRQETRSLADLNLPHACKEVVDLNTSSVVLEIERSILSIAKSILAGNGFGYSVPSRSSVNQLYVPELHRIVLQDKASFRQFANISSVRKTAITTRILQLVHQLCTKQIHVTKRDLFYTDVKVFQEQGQSDTILDDVSCMLGSTRSSLNVVASEKGVVIGRLIFIEDGDGIDCTKMGVGGKAIPPNIDKVRG